MHHRSSSEESRLVIALATALLCAAGTSVAAPVDRVTGQVDARRVRTVPGNLHRLAKPQFDQGAVEPAMRMSYMMLMTKLSSAQQMELDQIGRAHV